MIKLQTGKIDFIKIKPNATTSVGFFIENDFINFNERIRLILNNSLNLNRKVKRIFLVPIRNVKENLTILRLERNSYSRSISFTSLATVNNLAIVTRS